MGALFLAAAVLSGAEEDARVLAEVAESALRSSVVVELWTRKWEGRQPEASGWRVYGWDSAREALRDNRPVEHPGILTGDGKTALVLDPLLAPQFVARAAVSKGGVRVPAAFAGYLTCEPGVILRLERNLPGAAPVRFERSPENPFGLTLFGVGVRRDSDGWLAKASALGGPVGTNGLEFWVGASGGPFLVFDEARRTVGYSLSGMLGVPPGRYLWRGEDVLSQEVVTPDELDRMKAALTALLRRSAVRVRIQLRREEETGPSGRLGGFMRFSSGEEEGRNERLATGLVVADDLIVVPVQLKREQIVRIERITAGEAEGAREAEFVGAFRRFHLVVVKVKRPDEWTPLGLADARTFAPGEFLLKARVSHATGRRKEAHEYDRFDRYIKGPEEARCLKLRVEPQGEEVIFDRSLRPVAVCVARRPDEIEEERYYGGGEKVLLTAGELVRLLGRGKEAFDPALSPLDKKMEKRLVWLGVEFQYIDKDLARAKGVELATRGGKIGLLVSHVYAGSPAEAAGIERGDVLLRVTAPGRPEPVELGAEEHGRWRSGYAGAGMMDLPDDMPEEIRAQYLARMGPPWPSRRSELTEKLTRIGPGSRATFEYARGKDLKKAEVDLAHAPEDFQSAGEHKDEPLGLTVKPVTYEVCDYYRRSPAAAGVVVTKVEPGSRAATARVLPYEIIEEIDRKPVRTVDDLKARLAEARKDPGRKQVELKLVRLGKSRLVRVAP